MEFGESNVRLKKENLSPLIAIKQRNFVCLFRGKCHESGASFGQHEALLCHEIKRKKRKKKFAQLKFALLL